MFVFLWFGMVGLVVLGSFTFLGVTLYYWLRQRKELNGTKTTVPR